MMRLVILVPGILSMQAQGSIYVSNLGESLSGYGRGYQSFQTGVANNGYSVNSVTLLMGNWLDDASNFTVSIFSDIDGQRGTSLATLNGDSDPRTAGQYAYVASDLILSAGTTYWIDVRALGFSPDPRLPPGGYAWQITKSANYASNDGWSIPRGGNSIGGLGDDSFQFAVNATAVPEPGIAALMLLGLVGFGLCRRSAA